MPNAADLQSRLSRRKLLKLGVGVGGVLALSATGLGYAVLRLPKTSPGRAVLSDDEVAFVDALAETCFPPGNVLGLSGKEAQVGPQIDAMVHRLFAREQRVVRALFALIDRWPQLSLQSTSRFSQLPLRERVAVMHAWEASAREERRGLASLLRLLVAMPYFEHPDVLKAAGHRFGCAS